MDLQLRPHQMKCVEELREGFRAGHRVQLLYAPTGFGKTEVAIYLMKAAAEKMSRTAIIMDRIVLVDQTSDRLTKYAIPHGVLQASHWNYAPKRLIQVCSAQTLESRDEFPDFDLAIIDECFRAGTKIATPSGEVDIDNVQVGDVVLNQCGVGVVEAISIKPATETYLLEFDDGTSTECTGNHPFFTPSGWKTARGLEVGESFFSIEAVRLLWQRIQTLGKEGRKREGCFGVLGTGLEQAGDLLKVLLKEVQKPNEQSPGQAETARTNAGDQAQTYQARRERALATFAAVGFVACPGRRMGGRVFDSDQDEASWNRLSDLLQDRHRQPNHDDRYRGGRRESWRSKGEATGQKESGISCFPRLVRISRIERESPVPVFNLQVSGHPSYFADGKLVHNCHIARKSVTEFIKSKPNMKVIGLTATPFTKGLGKIYEHVVTGASTEFLVTKEWLAPLKVYIAKQIDMTGAKKVAGEWAQDVATERGMKLTGDIVAEWIKKTHEIFGEPRKTIVFCSGVAHGTDLAEQFAKQGYQFIPISYKDNDEFKREAIADFAKPDTKINGLIATDILTRGFDVPDVMIGVSARPFSKSLSSHIQQLGRVMRSHPSKKFGVWLCHSGNFMRFMDTWDDVYSNGVHELKDDAEKPRREPTDAEKYKSKCPKCGLLWVKGSLKCAGCGYEKKPPRSQIEAVAGRMEELARWHKANDWNPQKFYSELLWYAQQKNYNPNWAAHKFKEKFGNWPRGLSTQPLPPSAQTVGWIRSRMIAYAKSRRFA